MKGSTVMICEKLTVIAAVQIYMNQLTRYGFEQKVLDVHMTRSGKFIVRLAQLDSKPAKVSVEQPTSNRQVVGSSPTADTKHKEIRK